MKHLLLVVPLLVPLCLSAKSLSVELSPGGGLRVTNVSTVPSDWVPVQYYPPNGNPSLYAAVTVKDVPVFYMIKLSASLGTWCTVESSPALIQGLVGVIISGRPDSTVWTTGATLNCNNSYGTYTRASFGPDEITVGRPPVSCSMTSATIEVQANAAGGEGYATSYMHCDSPTSVTLMLEHSGSVKLADDLQAHVSLPGGGTTSRIELGPSPIPVVLRATVPPNRSRPGLYVGAAVIVASVD